MIGKVCGKRKLCFDEGEDKNEDVVDTSSCVFVPMLDSLMTAASMDDEIINEMIDRSYVKTLHEPLATHLPGSYIPLQTLQ